MGMEAHRIFDVKMSNDTAEILLYAAIGEDYFGGVGANEFADRLSAAKGAKQIDIRINSPGGDVFAGYAMYNLLSAHPATVNVFIDGQAASIASVVAMAGDNIEISANGTMMIHNPWVAMAGNSLELRAMADRLDMHAKSIVKTYAARTGMGEQELSDMMSARPDGSEFSAERALELGFVDSIAERKAMAAFAKPSVVRWRDCADPALDDGAAIMAQLTAAAPDPKTTDPLSRLMEINALLKNGECSP